MDPTRDQAESAEAWRATAPSEAATVVTPGSRATSAEGGAPPESVGGYRILERIGRGGMGEVFVAFDERLQRKVALKAIRADRRLDRESRERFLREARVLSSLDHPRICRIHDYLDSASGDYLVLELIEGESLAPALPRLALPQRLDVAEQLADVLATAHAAGIVHRDLKPDNVMLTPSGEIKVLDFGLARLAAGVTPSTPSASEDASAPVARAAAIGTRSIWTTQRADVLAGTPMYMSPEQARGDTITAASDMYALGLVLQEMFTGQPPYESGLDVHQLLDRARVGLTRPVTGIDRDLAALIRRLEALEPAARPTASDARTRLAWIRSKPRRRLRRLVVAAAVIVAALAGLKYTVDLGRERGQAIVARNDAEDLLPFMIGDLRAQLEPVGRLDVLDAVGDKALEYFSRLPEEDLGDDDLYRRGRALQLIGEVRLAEGNYDAAEAAFAESLALTAGAVARNPDRREWLLGLGASHFYVGSIHLDRGELDPALAAFDAYGDAIDKLVVLDPSDPTALAEMAMVHQNRGAVYEAMGKLGEALASSDAAIEIKRRRVESEPDHPERRRSLAHSLAWRALILKQMGDFEASCAALRDELGIWKRLVATDPRHAPDRFQLATCHSLLGDFLHQGGDVDEALVHYRQLQRLSRELVAIDPANAEWRRGLGVSHRYVARIHLAAGDDDAALAELRAGLEIFADLIGLDPGVEHLRVQHALQQRDVIGILARREAWSAAEAEARAALDVLAPLAAADMVSVEASEHIAVVRLEHGRALERLGDTSAAREAWAKALATIAPAAERGESPELKRILALAYLRLDRLPDAAPIVQRLHGTTAWNDDLDRLAREKGVHPDDA